MPALTVSRSTVHWSCAKNANLLKFWREVHGPFSTWARIGRPLKNRYLRLPFSERFFHDW